MRVLLSVVVVGCGTLLSGCSLDVNYHLFTTELESADGWRAFLWPRERGGTEFRVVLDNSKEGLQWWGNLSVPPRALEIKALMKSSGGKLASITVAIYSNGGPGRTSAQNIIDAVTPAAANVSSHIIVLDEDWSDVDSMPKLNCRLREARVEVKKQLPFEGGIFGILQVFAAMAPLSQMSFMTVIPLAGTPRRVVVNYYEPAVFERSKTTRNVFKELTHEGLVSLVERIQSASDAEFPGFWVLPIIPIAMPEPHRQSFDAILRRLYVVSSGNAVISMAWTSSRYEEFKSLEEVERRMREGDFPANPVQEK